MRLIDADELILFFKTNSFDRLLSTSEIIEKLEETPTAYDIGKVNEQVFDELIEVLNSYHLDMKFELLIKHVSEYIKKGGVK